MSWGKLGPVAVALVTVLAIAACTSTSAPAPPPERPRPTLSPLRLSDSPLWTYEDGRNVELRAGLVLLNHGDQHLVLADAATGLARWELTKGHELDDGAQYQESFVPGPGVRHLVGSGSTLGVLVEHETGLARVSAEDGSVVWQTSLLEPGWNQVLNLRAVDDRIALVSLTDGPPNRPGYAGVPARTVALDVGSGAVVWETTDGVWPSLIAGGTVLGQEARGRPDLGPTVGFEDGTVVGMDLITGRRLWDLTDRFVRSTLVAATPDVAVVAGVTALTPDRREVMAVSVATGEEVAGFPSEVTACDTDRRTLVACVADNDPRYALYTFSSGDRSVRRAAAGGARSVRLAKVKAGRIILAINDAEMVTRWRTLDAAGNVLDARIHLPGLVLAMSNQYAAFAIAPRGPDRKIAMYEISQ